jgi:hypothetical protein
LANQIEREKGEGKKGSATEKRSEAGGEGGMQDEPRTRERTRKNTVGRVKSWGLLNP